MRSALAAVVLSAAPALAQPLTTAFTYQGELLDNSTLATGTYDFRFALYDSAGGITQVGSTLCANDIAVINGQFTVQLDFGPLFSGQQRHLEVRVRQDAGLTCGNTVTFAGTIGIPTTTRTLSICGADFTTNEFARISPNGSLFPRVNENGAAGTVAYAMAGIHLPEGATITEFRIFVLGGGVVPITATLRRTPLSSQTSTVMATLTTSGAATYSTTSISSPVIDNDANAYYAVFTWTNNGSHTLDVNGVQIVYTITSPTP